MNDELKSHYSKSRRGNEIQGLVSKAVKFGPAWRRSDTIEWVLFWMFIAGLAWIPYWYGSNDLIAWGINAVLFPGLVLIYELSILMRGKSHPVGINQLRMPALLLVAVVVWIEVQNATWTASSWQHPIWAMAADVLGRPIEGSISVNRDLTTLALVRLITAACVFWISVQLCRNASRASYFITAIVTITSAYAAYGLIAFAMMQAGNTSSRSFVTSSFINHNHFATYAGIGFVAVCGLIFRIYQREVPMVGGSIQFRIASIIETTGRKAALPLGGAFLILVALLLTGSRGGIIVTGLGVFVLVVLTVGLRASVSSELKGTIVVGALLVGGAFLAFSDIFVSALTERGLTDANRIAVYMITLRSIFDAPLLGYGYGTFVDVFPMFRDRSISVQGIWEQAHNTYLEVFQGLGLAFGSMLIASVVLLVLKCFKGATARQRNMMVPGVATSVACLVGVHALVDFSLQMQAVALTFMALLGAGLAQSKSSRLALND